MAVLWFTGFEGGHQTKEPFYSVTGSGLTVGTDYARTGDYGCQLEAVVDSVFAGFLRACSNTNGDISAGFDDDTRIHFYMKIITLPPGSERDMLVYSERTGSVGLTLVLEDDGSLSLSEVNISTNAVNDLGNTTATYDDGLWHAIQIKDDWHGGSPSHSYELIVDDVSKISGTTDGLAAASVSTVYFGKLDNAFNSSYEVYIDDVAITSDDYIAYPFSINMFVPDADGTYTDWARTGFGLTYDWQAVDEIPPDDNTTYIRSNVADERSSFLCEDSVGTGLGKAIAAVKANYVCLRGAGGDTTHFFIRDSGGTDRDTPTAVALTAAYKAYATIWVTNPATSAAWSSVAIDATEIGILCAVVETVTTRCTALQLHVLYAGLTGRPMIAYNFGG